VQVVAPAASLVVGTTVQLLATARAAGDVPLPDRPVVWASEDEAVATVTAAGLLTARAPGRVWLRASCEGRTARVEVEIAAPAPAAPTIASLEPAAVRAGAGTSVTVRVLGSGFVAGTTARWNGAGRPTVVESATALRVTLPAGDVEQPSTGALTVHAPGPDGAAAAATLPVVAAATLAAFAPASVVAGTAEGFTLALRGAGFTPASQVTWNGAPRAATFVSADELRIAVTAADVAAAGERTVAVVTEGPAGGRTEARFPVKPRAAALVIAAQGGDAWTWPGHALVLEARAFDAGAAPVDEREVAWRVGDAAVAALAPGGPRSAVLQGGAAGRTWAEAALDGVTTRRAVLVHDAPAFDLVYTVGTGDARGIGVWSPRGGGTAGRFPLGVVAFDPAPSPDGRFIAFTGAPRGAGVDANHDVYVVARDGTGLRRVTTDAGYDGQPAWSPDGRRLAFVSTRAGHADVYTMAADGGDVRRLTDARVADPPAGSGNSAVRPAWSPDGAQLAYTVGVNGRSGVWVMRADGTAKRALGPDAGADDFDPAWTPDGERVAFRRVPRAGGAARILTLDAATGTNAGTWADLDRSGLPAFSPDGRWLAVSHPTTTALEAPWVRPLFPQGGGARQLLAPALPGTAPHQVRWIRRP
jgi:dipeptidyl aminopeptidase/acylaminoacyl peptidase